MLIEFESEPRDDNAFPVVEFKAMQEQDTDEEGRDLGTEPNDTADTDMMEMIDEIFK